jgi:hypothetical protein
MRATIGGPLGVRQIERVGFDDHRSAKVQLLSGVIHGGTIELHFVALDAAEAQYLVQGRFKEGPLIAFEIDHTGE